MHRSSHIAAQLRGPIFGVRPEAVSFLRGPAEYLASMKELTSGSKRRVFWSGLYLGSDSLSQDLVSSAVKAMHNNPDLCMSMLFDCGRGTREEAPGSTSVTTAMPLIERGAQMHLWKSPNVVPVKESVLGKRLSELLGVQHAKVHVFDDTVMLSGANLSRSYFEDRKDRYVIIRDASLADFYHQFLEITARASYFVASDGRLRAGESADSVGGKLRLLLDQMHDSHRPKDFGSPAASDSVFVAPTIQLGVCQVTQDQENTEALMNLFASARGGRFVFTSGYFNLTRAYESWMFQLAQRLDSVSVIVSAPESNAWFNSKGYSRDVPAAYSWLEGKFLSRLPRQNSTLRMLEWFQNGWSFHCKGLWFFGSDGKTALTILGSANFGHRSVHLDLEAQAIMFSENPHFQRLLEGEVRDLEQSCSQVTLEQVRSAERRPPWFWRLALPVIKKWM